MRPLQNLSSFPRRRESTGRQERVAVILALRQYPQGEGTGIDRYGAALPRYMGDSTWMDMDRH